MCLVLGSYLLMSLALREDAEPRIRDLVPKGIVPNTLSATGALPPVYQRVV